MRVRTILTFAAGSLLTLSVLFVFQHFINTRTKVVPIYKAIYKAPAYIGDVYVDRSGLDGLKIRLRLRDNEEHETASDGTLDVTISDAYKWIWTNTYQVKATDFKVEEYYLHDRLLLSLPRITDGGFRGGGSASDYGKVECLFTTTNGLELHGINNNVRLVGQ